MVEDFINFSRALAIALWMSVNEHSMRAEFGRGAQRHGRMHAKLASRIRCGRDHAALIPLPSHDDSLPFQRRIKQLFHRHKESIHVDVKDSAHWKRSLLRRAHRPRLPPTLVDADVLLRGEIPGKVLVHAVAHQHLP